MLAAIIETTKLMSAACKLDTKNTCQWVDDSQCNLNLQKKNFTNWHWPVFPLVSLRFPSFYQCMILLLSVRPLTVAAQATQGWAGIPKVERSILTRCSNSCDLWRSGGTALCTVVGVTSQLNLLSLTPLFVAGCGRLQLGVPHWATSVDYCK